MQAGFGVISDDGLKALTVDRLCKRVGATKGSFYWHFTDLSAYRTALIDAWATLRDEDRGHFEDLADLPPRERLIAMMTALVTPRHWMLERAMREWARSEPTVAAAVRESDRRVLAAVRRAFVDAGLRPRGGRRAGQRDVRGGYRLPASVWPATQFTVGGRPGAFPRHHAAAMTVDRSPY